MRTQARKMPFTEEQMRQIYDTNLIDFAVRHGFEMETIIVDRVKENGKSKLVKIGQGKKQSPIQSPRVMNMLCSNHECNLPKQTSL